MMQMKSRSGAASVPDSQIKILLILLVGLAVALVSAPAFAQAAGAAAQNISMIHEASEALVRLFLPECWFGEAYQARRQQVGIPADLKFKTKVELAWDGIEEIIG